MDTIPNPIFHLDQNCRFAGCNRAFEEFIGLNRSEVIGKTIFDVFPGDLAEGLDRIDHQLISVSDTRLYEASLKNARRETKEVLFYLACYCDTDGRVQGLLATMLDITQRKHMELQLKKHVNELEKANQKIIEQQKAVIEEERLKVLLQMAGATAHELNQPLMTLLGNIELMALSRHDPQQVDERMTLIEESGQRIAHIVKKIQNIRQDQTVPYPGDTSIVKIDQALDVLLVEDNDKDFQSLSKMLKACGNVSIQRAKDLEEGFSIGITVFTATQDDTAERLMRRADEALYLAKENGRNRTATA